MNLKIAIILLLFKEGLSEDCDGDDESLYNTNNTKINFFHECALATKPCVVKCCPMGEVIRFSKGTHTCKSIEQVYKEVNFSEANKDEIRSYSKLKIRKTDGNITQKAFFGDFHLLHRQSFNSNTLFYFEEYTTFTDDGNAVFNGTDGLTFKTLSVSPPRFCVDIVVGTSKKKPLLFYRYFVRKDKSCLKNTRATLLVYGNFVSAFFSLLTLVVFGLLKPLHTKLHHLLFMGLISSHMVFAVLFACQIMFQYLVPEFRDDAYKRMDVCLWTAPITYYFLLSTFFWMNTMAFDIWSTFRALRKVNHESHRRSTYKKLRNYSLYAWGMPAIITAIAVGIDNAELPASVYKPKFKICHPDDTSNLVSRLYDQLPLVFVVVTNIGFFLRTVYNIWSSGQPILKLKAETSKPKKNSQIIIFIKLSFIMGISWVLELAQAPARDGLQIWAFVLLNFFNTCLGVVFFFVMVFKPSVFIMLCQRFKIENRWTRRSTQANTSTRTQESKLSKTVSKSMSVGNVDYEVMTADASKRNRDPLENARFIVSTVPDPV